MADKPENPPAFPGTMYGQNKSVSHIGMSLRDWFAGQVMAALISSPNFRVGALGDDNPINNERLAVVSFVLADAMLAERAKEQL